MPLLKAENLTHTYSIGTPFERVAISEINFTAEKGEYIGIIGATGSGKSTLLQHMNGLLKPTSGKVYYDGTDIHESKKFTRDVRFKIGLVFQYPEYQLFEATVFDDIAFGPRNMGLSDEEVTERTHEAAGFVGLGESFMKKSPFELSGGEKRRAAIAGVIAMRPEILILDEPTAGLDPGGQDEIIKNIKTYKKAHDATIILVTHNMEEIAKNAERIVVLNKGGVEMDGMPNQIFADPERLTNLGLAAPKAALIAERLRARGVNLKKDIYTLEYLKTAILELKRGEASA
ncbi:MAG: energy-coupling factor transporter ATPase [Oscillospiraceae bacterium]|nr:energy-coupling factor transporter ATPase [Oscillospiraceae bacterium]MCL2249649.1 energy-coupling factor transporter ATPase [Oscillospiraceae bacterium]